MKQYLYRLILDMRIISQIVLLFASSFVFSQKQIHIELKAPSFENDSLFLVFPTASKSVTSLYSMRLNGTDKNVRSFGNSKGAAIRVLPQNTISGTVQCPMPVMMMAPPQDGQKNFQYSRVFFIENGELKMEVSDKDLTLILPPGAIINNDYKWLKEYTYQADKKLQPFEKNNPEDVKSKEKLLQTYIKKNPESYPAFWELVDDFSKYGFHKNFLSALPLFSKKLKASSCFKDFEKILSIENSTGAGGNFPEINFETESPITKATFSDHKLTLIDYWSTTCKPCIEGLPELVKLYGKYKDKGMNFISVADEKTKHRMDLAARIFRENNVSWKNYFDTSKEFSKKLNAAGYPLFILVDGNGKIVSREVDGLETIEYVIEKHLN